MAREASAYLWIINLSIFHAQYAEYEGVACQITDRSVLLMVRNLPHVPSPHTLGIQDFGTKAREGDLVVVCNSPHVVGRIGVLRQDAVSRHALEVFLDSIEFAVEWLDTSLPYISRFPLVRANRAIRKVAQARIPDRLREILENTITLERYSNLVSAFLRPSMESGAAQGQRETGDVAIKKTGRGEKGGSFELYYGTNRLPSGDLRYNAYYSEQLGPLRVGICWVNVPPGHESGKIERPKWWKARWSESTGTDVMITGLEEIDIRLFKSTLSERLKIRDRKEALLFVHGYNVDFKEAAWRTGQIVYDLSFSGIGAFFSWPSAGAAKDYLYDLQQARNSIPALQEFIRILINVQGIKKLHIIAHSLGNYVLSCSISELERDQVIQKLDVIRQLVLCAPDIDQTEFDQQILPHFENVGAQRTLYANDKDRAIAASEWLRLGLKRLGDAGSDLFVRNGIHTVDATLVSTGLLGHGYYANNRELINDLFMITRHELPPDQRNLHEKKSHSGLSFWELPA